MKKEQDPNNFFTYEELGKIPDVPGVYAWYAFPSIGKADFVEQLTSLGEDEGDKNLRLLLANFTKQFSPSPLKINALVAFRDGWKGELEPVKYSSSTAKLLEQHIDYGESNNFPGESIKTVFSSEKTRNALVNSLSPNNHIMWSPIYIGSAKRLQFRLRQHVEYYKNVLDFHIKMGKEVSETLQGIREIFEKLSDEKENKKETAVLAYRLFEAGFDLEQIRLTYVSFEGLGLDNSEQLALARLYEWLLNTWNKPLMGRV